MKSVLVAIIISTFSFSAFAKEANCQAKVEKSILKLINKRMSGDSDGTRSITAVKAIQIGDFLETFAVAASDEVDPTEWVLVVESEKCKIKFLDLVNDGRVSEIFN